MSTGRADLSISFITRREHEHAEEQPALPQEQTHLRCDSFEENYSGSHLLKHNCSRGGLLAVEIPNSFEAPAVRETDEAGS